MELSSILGTLLSNDSVSAMSKSTKAESSLVQDVMIMALPHLLSGISTQAESKSTSGSLVQALIDHGQDDASDVGSFIENVDVDDGEKIIGHLLGTNKNTVAKDIAKKTGGNSDQVIQLLATAAPLIMTIVGQQASKESAKKEPEPEPEKPTKKTPEKTTGKTIKSAPAKASGKAPAKASGKAPEKTSGKTTEKTIKKAPEKSSGKTTKKVPAKEPEKTSSSAIDAGTVTKIIGSMLGSSNSSSKSKSSGSGDLMADIAGNVIVGLLKNK